MARTALFCLFILAAFVVAMPAPRPPASVQPSSMSGRTGETDPTLGTGVPDVGVELAAANAESTVQFRAGAPSPRASGTFRAPRPSRSLPPVAASSGKPATTPHAPQKRPVVTRTPRKATTMRVNPKYGVPWLVREGIASHMGSGFPPSYLALPHGPGWRARICGAGDCVTMTSNDAGPALYLQRQGRVADLSVAVFERVCGVPASVGLCVVSVTILGRA